MAKSISKQKLARLLYDAFPDHDLLPLERDKDCADLDTLHVAAQDCGDTLFAFVVAEVRDLTRHLKQRVSVQMMDQIIQAIQRAEDDLGAVARHLDQYGPID